jgi:hypothetical protein
MKKELRIKMDNKVIVVSDPKSWIAKNSKQIADIQKITAKVMSSIPKKDFTENEWRTLEQQNEINARVGEMMQKHLQLLSEEEAKKLCEATPKSTRERVYRHLRKTKPKGKKRDMVGRVVPKKTGNNDPTRGGKRERRPQQKVSKEVKEATALLGKALAGKISKEKIAKHPQRAILFEMVSHLIAVNMGGWRRGVDVNGTQFFINESGRTASSKFWSITTDGRLEAGKKPVDYDLDKLFELRELCDGQKEIQEEKEGRTQAGA